MSEVKGIKEISELLEALKLLASSGKKIAKDGLGIEDLGELISLSKDLDKLLEGFKDISEIDDEIKDLDEAEMVILISKLYGIVKEIKEA